MNLVAANPLAALAAVEMMIHARRLRELNDMNDDYLKEAIDTLQESYDTIKYIKEYLPRLCRVTNLPAGALNMDTVMQFENALQLLIQAAPKNRKEWVEHWVAALKASGGAPKKKRGDCVICATEDTELVSIPCKCKETTFCLECMLNSYYAGTEGLKKSSFDCPLCKSSIRGDVLLGGASAVGELAANAASLPHTP
jgi:hypothetical protein